MKLLTVVVAMGLASALAIAGPSYTIAESGFYMGTPAAGIAINDLGLIAWSDGTALFRKDAASGFIDSYVPGGTPLVQGVTDSGVVYGNCGGGFTWSGGTFAQLRAYPGSPGTSTTAWDLNSSGDMVGGARPSGVGDRVPTIWRGLGDPEWLYGPGGLAATGWASVINGTGLIGGKYWDGYNGVWQACYWDGGGFATDIPYDMEPSSINNAGVMGFYDWNGKLRLWTLADGLQVAATFPGAAIVNPLAISESTTVVGYAAISGWETPFVWSPLEGLSYLPLPDGAIEGMAMDINADGTIVGWYSTSGGTYGVVWVPEPTALSLLALGGLITLRRRGSR